MRKKITQKDFAEFYVLSALDGVIRQKSTAAHEALVTYRNSLVKDIVEFYIKNLQRACVEEAMHSSCRKWPNRKAQEDSRKHLESIGLAKSREITENFLYARKNADAASNLYLSAERMIIVFRYMNWSSAYGGEAWARITELFKELLLSKTQYKNFGMADYDPNNGYDTATHVAISLCRAKLGGTLGNGVLNTMHIIDMIHQVEHNTGSIFTKFPGDMTQWLENMLNEKAVTHSIQLLRDKVGDNVLNAMKELNIQDEPMSIVEHELGDVIISRQLYKQRKNFEVAYNQNIDAIDEDLHNKYISQAVYDDKKAKLDEKLKRDMEKPAEVNFYSNLLSNYRHLVREHRGLVRAVVARADEDERLCNPANNVLQYVKDILYSDRDLFACFRNAPKWKECLIQTLAPYYGYIDFKWRREATDFLYSEFENLKPTKYFDQVKINALYENLKADGYDMSAWLPVKPTKVTKTLKSIKMLPWDANKLVVYYDVYAAKDFEPKNTILLDKKTAKAKEFATINAGKEIVGQRLWLYNAVNKYSPKKVDFDKPIGTIIGYKPGGNICFIPSQHWKDNGFVPSQDDSAYFATTDNTTKEFYSVALSDIAIYDEAAIKAYAKKKASIPTTADAFAKKYAGKQVKHKNAGKNSKLAWQNVKSMGTVIGYVQYSNIVIVMPSDEMIAHGLKGSPFNPSGKLTDASHGNPHSYGFQLTEIKLVDLDDTTTDMTFDAPMSVKEFAEKYAGKFIKKSFGKQAEQDMIAGTVIGFKPPKINGTHPGSIIWVPTKEYQDKYNAEYATVRLPRNAVLTSQYKFDGVHWSKMEYITPVETIEDKPVITTPILIGDEAEVKPEKVTKLEPGTTLVGDFNYSDWSGIKVIEKAKADYKQEPLFASPPKMSLNPATYIKIEMPQMPYNYDYAYTTKKSIECSNKDKLDCPVCDLKLKKK